jgi:CheY-like chemotaxis protein
MPKTILLADDSLTIRKVVELTFSDSDIRVESVGSGREALDRIETVLPDLVLADVVMPEPSGYEICEKIKTSTRPVPVLLLAGTFEPFDVERARACGADGHLVKPFESGVLIERVETLLTAAETPAARAAEHAIEEVLQDLDSAHETEGLPEEPGVSSWEEGGETIEATVAPEPEGAAVARSRHPADPDPVAMAEPHTGRETYLAPNDIDAIARAVVERLSTETIRAIAWEVVPDVAERLVRERIRQLEQDSDE